MNALIIPYFSNKQGLDTTSTITFTFQGGRIIINSHGVIEKMLTKKILLILLAFHHYLLKLKMNTHWKLY